MRKSIYLFLTGACFVLTGCFSDLVPNNFPLGDFYSYAPYQLYEKVYYTSNGDTITYEVFGVTEEYIAGRKKKDGDKELVNKKVAFKKADSTEGFELTLISKNRAIFDVSLKSLEEPYSIDANYRVDFSDEDIWSKSFNNSKIFNYFANVITLSQNEAPSAQVWKQKGLHSFTDASGRVWFALEK